MFDKCFIINKKSALVTKEARTAKFVIREIADFLTRASYFLLQRKDNGNEKESQGNQ